MTADYITKRLLTCGAVAGPLFVIVILVDGALRPGYRPLRQTGSELATGSTGWIQITNFLVCGSLFVLFAAGVRRALPPGLVSWMATALTGLFGAGLIVSGLFVTDIAGEPGHSWPGTVHNAAGTVVFLALPLLTFTWTARSAQRRSWAWATTSAAVGVSMLILIQGLAVPEYRGLYQRLTIALGWAWIIALALHLRRAPHNRQEARQASTADRRRRGTRTPTPLR